MIINTNKKIKYAAVSDLHGMNPYLLNKVLKSAGFVAEKHTLVVAGDLEQGMGYDDELIKYLMKLPNKIVIRGNHDHGPDDSLLFGNVNAKNLLSAESAEYVRNLPYEYETDDFIVAHGMYITQALKDALPDERDRELLSVWGSPLLLGQSGFDWQNVPKYITTIVNKIYPTLKSYTNDLPKQVFLGHFSENKAKPLGTFKKKQGLMCINKKIQFLDSGLMYRSETKQPELKVYVW